MSADIWPARTGTSPQPSAARMSGSAAFQRAKGLLAAWFDLTPGEAENLLLTWSCENKVSACEVATALVSDIHEGRPSGCSTAVLRYLEDRLREVATVSGPIFRAATKGIGPLPVRGSGYRVAPGSRCRLRSVGARSQRRPGPRTRPGPRA